MRIVFKLVTLCIACFALSACATEPIRRVDGKQFISESPPLVMDFKYEIRDVKEFGQNKLFTFYSSDVRPVVVEIKRTTLSTRRIDYYYSIENVVSNADYYLMDIKYFDDHKWAKVTKVNDHGYLMCGYMTRKDHWMIFIHNYSKLTAEGIKRYVEYKKTLKPSESDLTYINQMFEDLNKSTKIIH